jgi:hypothetical protein
MVRRNDGRSTPASFRGPMGILSAEPEWNDGFGSDPDILEAEIAVGPLISRQRRTIDRTLSGLFVHPEHHCHGPAIRRSHFERVGTRLRDCAQRQAASRDRREVAPSVPSNFSTRSTIGPFSTAIRSAASLGSANSCVVASPLPENVITDACGGSGVGHGTALLGPCIGAISFAGWSLISTPFPLRPSRPDHPASSSIQPEARVSASTRATISGAYPT